MIHPALALASPLIAASFTLPPDFRRPDPADLWTAGVDLSTAELSGLLEDCTGFSIDADTDADGLPVFYLVHPAGDRDPDPWDDLADLAADVGWRIDEALADCAP